MSHIQASLRNKAQNLVGLDAIDHLASPADTEAATDDSRTLSRLMATIHRLAPADRQVMLLYLEDLTAAEIGDVTGLSAGAVATRISRLKALLAQVFKPTEDRS